MQWAAVRNTSLAIIVPEQLHRTASSVAGLLSRSDCTTSAPTSVRSGAGCALYELIAEAGAATLSIATAAVTVRDANSAGRRKVFLHACGTDGGVSVAHHAGRTKGRRCLPCLTPCVPLS